MSHDHTFSKVGDTDNGGVFACKCGESKWISNSIKVLTVPNPLDQNRATHFLLSQRWSKII